MNRSKRLFLGGLGAVIIAAILLAAGTLPPRVLAAPPGQQGTATAPQVVETQPRSGEEIPLDSGITFFFDQPMLAESVRGAFSIEPSATGALEMPDESTLVFTPDRPLRRATAYTLTIGTGATSAAGQPLAEPFTLRVNTVGYLEVAQVLPALHATDIATDSVITVIFNRPVVPLVTAEEMDTLPNPLVIEPATDGAGEWLNTSIYLFRPDRLQGGTTYTVTVSAGLTDVTGGILEGDFAWSFDTVQPLVLSVSPRNNATGVALESPITVRFNQAMDRASVEEAFILAEQSKGRVSGAFEWAEDSASFTFQPDDMLELGGFYTARVNAKTARAINGTTPLSDSYAWHFIAVETPHITSTTPCNDCTADPWGGFSIKFATPMDRTTLTDRIIIDPAPAAGYDTYYSDYDNRLNLSFPLEPSTAYTVTLQPGMADVYGNTIAREMVVRFNTRPYAPDVTLQVPGDVGLYSAYAPETRLFSTYLNISRMDLSLYRSSISDLMQITEQYGWGFWSTYAPNEANLLRRWSIPSEAELNERRYQLLPGTAEGESAPLACPGAPAPRLEVGGMAVVLTDPDPLRARSGSPSGDIVDLLYKGYQAPVLGGPVCSDGLYWWQIRLRDGSPAWVAEGDTREYYLGLATPAPEQPASTPEILTARVGGENALAPGIYILNVAAPEIDDDRYDSHQHMMVVATANVTLKYSNDAVLAWVTDLNSGEPVAGIPVTFYGSGGEQIASAVTDDEGLAVASIPRLQDLYQYIAAGVNTPEAFGFAANGWTWGIESYDFNQPANYYPQDTIVYLYTDRPIYRPGQPVYFRGVARARDDVTYTPPPFSQVPVQIQDNNGDIVYEETLPLTEFGAFSGQFNLAEDASLGYYELAAVLDDSEDAYYSGRNFRISFGVAEYRTPEFQVTLTPEQDQVVQGDTIRVMVESAYFFGGPVSNATATYTVQSQNYSFNYTGDGYYQFVDYNYDAGPAEYYSFGYGEVIANGTGVTDDQGRFMVEIPADLGDRTQSQSYTIEVGIADESGQEVYNRVNVVVHQGEVYVGLSPREYVGTAGEPNAMDVISVDWTSAPVPGQEIALEVVERRWSNVQEEDDSGRTTWTWEVEEVPVEGASTTVTTGSDGRAEFAFTPPAAGAYKIYATTHDGRGNEVRSSAFVWVSGPDYAPWRQQNSNRIDLITDRNSYQVGDMAEVLIASPWQGPAVALITIERGSVLHHEVIPLETNSTVYRFAIEDAYAPNVFVSALLVKGVDENTPVAEFRMGLTQIAVDPERRELTVTVTPDREQAGPRETVTYTVQTRDFNGDPVPAEVGVGLTDLAVLTIADPNSPPLMDAFYGAQGLSVRTAVPLTLSVDQLTQSTLDTVKGGGGGGEEAGIFEVRQEFVDTPYWNPTLVTDENGQAIFDVTLPDNLTTWRLDARAVSDGRNGVTLVGQSTNDLLSTKPLLVRPVAPRFFVVGDVVTLASVVNNNTGETMTVDASLQGAGVTFNSPQDITAEIPTGGRHRFEWTVTVGQVQNVDLVFSASGNDGQYTDASKPPTGQGDDRLIPVYRFEVPETVGTGGMIDQPGTVTEAISLPRTFDVTQGDLTIQVQPSLAASTIEGLTYLRNFPYQCIEQTVSRFLPNIMTYRALANLGIENDELKTNLDAQVGFGLQRLYAQQHADGGWGWFASGRTDIVNTAYAVIGLVEAQKAGFSVSDDVIQRAVGYLNGQLIVVDQSTATWQLNRQAFVLYALARADRGNIASTMNLYEFRQRLSQYAQGFLAVSLHRLALDMQDEINAMVAALVSNAVLSANGAHWEEGFVDWWNWNTDTRSTAIVLGALIELDPGNALLAQAVRWLMVARTADHWETTQETAWALMALTDWMVTTGELEPDYLMQTTLNNASLLEQQATPANIAETYTLVTQVADLLADAPNLVDLTHGEGPGVMYYTAYLRAFLPVPEVKPLNRGIIVDRRYSMPDDPDRTPINSAPVGQNVRVTLTIIAPNNLHYAVIEDPIPAGSDAVDPNLNISQQLGTQPEVDVTNPLSRGWGWWYFNNIEYRDEKVVIYADYLPAGTYEYSYVIRTGLPGEYNVIPPTGQQFYFPEVYGRGAGSVFSILPASE